MSVRAAHVARGQPIRDLEVQLGDALAATFAALGTLVALQARHRTGRGQVVDSAIYEAVLALMESLLPEWELAGYQRELNELLDRPEALAHAPATVRRLRRQRQKRLAQRREGRASA